MSTTWREVKQDIETWAVTDWLSGQYDEYTLEDWAQQTADGCQYVIYYRHQDDLWTEGTITPVHEAEAELDWLDGDIQTRIQACVFWAIYNALVQAGQEAIEENHALAVRQVNTTRRIAGEYITFPTLETYRAPKEA